MLIKELTFPAEQASTSIEIKSRRRLKLNGQASPPHNPAPEDIPAPFLDGVDASSSHNDLTSIRGIVFSILLSVPLWVSIAVVAWAMLD